MRFTTLVALTASAGSLAVHGRADAVFVNLSESIHTTVVAGGQLRDVYRVYAHFDNPGDMLLACFGNTHSPFTVTLNGATAYNPPAGGNLPRAADVIASLPNLEWDSYVTIGLAAGYAPEPVPGFYLGSFFPTFITSAGIINNTDMGWAHIPVPDSPGISGPSLKVMIMQITVNSGDPAPSGSLGLTYLAAGTGQTVSINNQSFAPAPGALAFLGLLGFARPRRRRPCARSA